MAKWLKLYMLCMRLPRNLTHVTKCSKFLANTGFVTIRLLRFGVKVKRAYYRDNFLDQRPLQDMRRLSGDDYFSRFNRTLS